MRKFVIFAASFLLLFVLAVTVRATNRHTFSLPSQAKPITPGVFDLGSVPVNGRLAQGIAFVHYKDGKSHKPNHKKGKGGTACYDFLARGARWKTTEPYILDEADSGLDPIVVASETKTSFETWDSQVGFDIFGDETTGIVNGADTEKPDGKNEIYFAEITDPNVIAVTIVWGYFSGPPFAREIIEYDVVFDYIDYTWGDATVHSSVMDYQNIATHEFGHAGGMADLYDTSCSEETMYGYASLGETKKRDLNTGDIDGITKLYK